MNTMRVALMEAVLTSWLCILKIRGCSELTKGNMSSFLMTLSSSLTSLLPKMITLLKKVSALVARPLLNQLSPYHTGKNTVV